VLDRALSLYRQHDADFGPTFAAEKPTGRDGATSVNRTFLEIDVRHVANWWLDGSPHAWFEDRAPDDDRRRKPLPAVAAAEALG
jgi:hypothetical protein